ncbi:hypothetical protein SeMB42_g06545, partial [Synchytrium endobioticum]
MKILAIVTISLCWPSIAVAPAATPPFSTLLAPYYASEKHSVKPYDYYHQLKSLHDLPEFLAEGCKDMADKRNKISEALVYVHLLEAWGKIPYSRMISEIAKELDWLSSTDNTLGLPFDDLRSFDVFRVIVSAEKRLKVVQTMKEFGQTILSSRLWLGKYHAVILTKRIEHDWNDEQAKNSLAIIRAEIPKVEQALADREARYNGLIEIVQGARDAAVNDK